MSDTTEHKKQSLVGVVVSDKMDKTRVVLVSRYVSHPKYKKFLTIHKRFKAHDQENAYHVGDRVRMEPSSPVSRHKAFAIVEKLGTEDVTRHLRSRA